MNTLIWCCLVGHAIAAFVRPVDQHHNFAVVIDAGSSGSRLFIYTWTSAGTGDAVTKVSPVLNANDEPLVKAHSPGLSSLAQHPELVLDYISVLLDFAVDHIPAEKHYSTRLMILATAGMRLLAKRDQKAVMDSVRSAIAAKYNFVVEQSDVEVISGNDEGLYQWIAVNHVLGRLSNRTSGTVGIMDMGGASIQIALQVHPDDLKIVQDEGAVCEFQRHSSGQIQTYYVYVRTFLGYGSNEAFTKFCRHLLLQGQEGAGLRHISGLVQDRPTANPCLPRDLRHSMRMAVQGSEDQDVFFVGTGHWDECLDRVRTLVIGAGMPSATGFGVPADFSQTHFYGLSEFWYSMENVLGHSEGRYSRPTFELASKQMCHAYGPSTLNNFTQFADPGRLTLQCFKSAWMISVLHDGFGLPRNYSYLVSVPNTLGSQVLHWTLGGLLHRIGFGAQHRSGRQLWVLEADIQLHYLIWVVLGLSGSLIMVRLRRRKRLSQVPR